MVLQRMHIGILREMGAAVVHGKLRNSHSPFLSPLMEATDAFTGNAIEGMTLEDKRTKC